MGSNETDCGEPKKEGLADKWWSPGKLKLTDKYNYISANKLLGLLHHVIVLGGLPAIYLICRLGWGYGIQGKENLRIIKKTSCITVSNHVHEMDSVMLTRAFYPYFPYFIVQKQNFEMFIVGLFVHILRGIPLPAVQDVRSLKKFRTDINHMLQTTTHKMHVFPEASVEPFYRGLRDFKKGAFYFAIHNNIPVLPMVFVCPKPRELSLLIGKPIYPAQIIGIETLKETQAAASIAEITRKTMQRMMDDFYAGVAEN